MIPARSLSLLLLAPLVSSALTADCGSGEPTPTPGPYGLTEREPNTTCIFQGFAEAQTSYGLERAFPNLTFYQPVLLTHAGDNSGRVFVVEKVGLIRVFSGTDAATSTTIFADLRSRVSASASEMGLLGLAFHPDYKNNGYFYVNYTADNPRRTVVSRFKVSGSPNAADLSSEQILLEITQPYANHNGGMLSFGPDGYLYIGVGDGGSGGDPGENGQDPQELLGSMLRIDVDEVDPGLPYAIPDDNPYAGGGGRPEIFAKGLRNPWRFSFDPVTGLLWAGDVGQDLYEEVDVVERGKNYGWDNMEGFHCYEPSNGCITNGMTLPVIEYPHSVGKSVTGGYVYRGARVPSLSGRYLYGDYVTGLIWALDYDAVNGQLLGNEQLLDTDLAISSFGEDQNREVYVVAYAGTIHRLRELEAAPAAQVFPTRLSETGCFTDVVTREPAPGVLPYDVLSPLWSDGEVKYRWLALPGVEQATFTDPGAWGLPDGTVLLKEFTAWTRAGDPTSEQRLETRLLLKLDGTWRGYTYRWNDTQTDAFLLEGTESVAVTVTDEGGQPSTYTHTFPSRQDCQSCHTLAAGSALGIQTGQLNRDRDYDGVTDNQIRSYDHIELFTTTVSGPYEAYTAWPDPTGDTGSLELRARSYLAANCSHCHLPGGTAVSTLDLRYETPLSQAQACGVPPSQGDMGVTGSLLIAPGDPSKSVLSLRMKTLGEGRMPPLATHVVDQEGAALVDAWIESLEACP